jgi:hypothetical protein
MTDGTHQKCHSYTGSDQEIGVRFIQFWACALLLHVLTAGYLPRIVRDPTIPIVHLILAISATITLHLPTRTPYLLAMASAAVASGWLEAPFLGNHWYIACLVNLSIIASVIFTRWSSSASSAGYPPVRDAYAVTWWILCVSYAFAAFAKLNTSFLDPTVSCSTLFSTQTIQSLTPRLAAVARDEQYLLSLLPWIVAGIEATIAVLLPFRRTRRMAAVLGIVFHTTIALNRSHLFYDFSSIMLVLFLLAFPSRPRSHRFLLSRQRILEVWGYCSASAIVLLSVGAISWRSRLIAALWFSFSLFVLIELAVVLKDKIKCVRRNELPQPTVRLKWQWMLVSIAFVSGLLPYLELRTAYSYNMYSNLYIAEGRTNHLFVRVSLPLFHRLRDRVTIIDSTDRGLRMYALARYEIPWDSFRTYVAKRPEIGVTFMRAGQRVEVERVDELPELRTPPRLWLQKLFPLRAVDPQAPTRCQEAFLPAL